MSLVEDYLIYVVNLDRCVEVVKVLIMYLIEMMCSKENIRFKYVLNLHIITGINKLKTAKHLSCECKRSFDGRKCNSNQKWNQESKIT